MIPLLILVSLLECRPSIKTLMDNYLFGDSIGFTLTNPCDTAMSYSLALERWNNDEKKWHVVDVDVFTNYMYVGADRTLQPGSLSIFNKSKDYGEHFLVKYYEHGGRFRYGMRMYRADAGSYDIVYSNEFAITAP
jgi:hypothetical protein